MNEARLNELLTKFPSLHILVVGDFFLDKYLIVDPALSETSLETGLEAHQVVKIRLSPGAAGTVVSNLRALDVNVSVVGFTGRDGEGFELRHGLLRHGVNIRALMEMPERFTPTYIKPMLRTGPSEQELNRIDLKNREPLTGSCEAELIAHLERLVPMVNGVIIADQVQERNCGVITDRVRESLARLAREHPAKPFAADSRVRIAEFEDVIIKPNLEEARAAYQSLTSKASPQGETPDIETMDESVALGRTSGLALFEKSKRPVFVTLGANGVLAVTDRGVEHVPGVAVAGEIDIVGAGDSVMAGLVAGLCAGGTAKEAAILGNLAASITIQQLGRTGTASRDQVRERFAETSQ